MVRLLLLIALLLPAAACSSFHSPFQSDEERKAEIDAKDDRECQAHAFAPGSLKYDDCRKTLADRRDQSDRAALGNRLLNNPPNWASGGAPPH
jgi:hypothetical protein